MKVKPFDIPAMILALGSMIKIADKLAKECPYSETTKQLRDAAAGVYRQSRDTLDEASKH
jgi:hypothetical protein